jgi:superfamily I DNA/RNA helicase
MRTRVQKIMKIEQGVPQGAGCTIQTFHAFCLKICRNFGENKNFNMYGTRQCINVVAEAMAELSEQDLEGSSGGSGNLDSLVAVSQRGNLEKDIKAHATRMQSKFCEEKSRVGGVDFLLEHESMGKIYQRYRKNRKWSCMLPHTYTPTYNASPAHLQLQAYMHATERFHRPRHVRRL